MPHTPTVKQAAFMMFPGAEAMFGGAGGGGKALALDTPIPTSTGWKLMGEIREGDVVFDASGKPTLVYAMSETMVGHRTYAVEFDDGEVLRADAEHQWVTMTATERAAAYRRTAEYRDRRRATRKPRGYNRKPWLSAMNRQRAADARDAGAVLLPPCGSVRTTSEILATLHHRGGTDYQGCNHSVRVAGPLDLPCSSLPLDPYVLGLWLGDGTAASGGFTTADEEVVAAFERAGFQPHRYGQKYSYGTHGLCRVLSRNGLLGHKHIPQAYLRASLDQRLALLQGLMDTDGTCGKDGGCAFTSTKPRLARGFHELALSLGLKATMNRGVAKLRGRIVSDCWDVLFTTRLPAFRLSHKAERIPVKIRGTQLHRYIVNVRPIESEPVKCLRTGSGTYLAGRHMVPTHNSDVGLMCMLQYADVERHASLIVRRTFQALVQPGALIERSHSWLDGTDAHWDGQSMMWRFPSKAILAFRHLNDRNALETIASAEYQDAYADELTQLTQIEYDTIRSRLRRPSTGPLSLVPLRMRGGTNPGGRGHEWVKARFVRSDPNEDKIFLQAKLNDNPYIDREAYIKTLSHLPLIIREAILEGNWDLQVGAGVFRREWFRLGKRPLAADIVGAVRYWDTAATEATGNNDPDWTVGTLLVKTAEQRFYICHAVRVRSTAGSVRRLAMDTAASDLEWIPKGKYTLVKEQGPGDDGKANADAWRDACLERGVRFHADKKTADKMERAGPWASACEGGAVYIVPGEWTEAFLDNHANFPDGDHDDDVDSADGAYHHLATGHGGILEYYEKKAKEALKEAGA